MTIEQNIMFVKMMLDDARAWLPTEDEVIATMAQAELVFIAERYKGQDERALRPLYRETVQVSSGTFITDSADGMPLLYPRACRLYSSGATDEYAVNAKFMDNARYFNYQFPSYEPITNFPRQAVYTIRTELNGTTPEPMLYFNGTSATTAKLWYIKKPQGYSTTNNYEIGEEYHHEICAIAAEMLNDIDVNEVQRSEKAFSNQFITMQDVNK